LGDVARLSPEQQKAKLRPLRAINLIIGEKKMWNGFAPVTSGYDPVLYESPEVKPILVLNAGPSEVIVGAWAKPEQYGSAAPLMLELRPGDQRIIGGCLVRGRLKVAGSATFAAIGWRIIDTDS
jgi:hypothetical protein